MNRNVFWAQALIDYLNETDKESIHTEEIRQELDIPESVTMEQLNAIIRYHPRTSHRPPSRAWFKNVRGWRFWVNPQPEE